MQCDIVFSRSALTLNTVESDLIHLMMRPGKYCVTYRSLLIIGDYWSLIYLRLYLRLYLRFG